MFKTQFILILLLLLFINCNLLADSRPDLTLDHKISWDIGELTAIASHNDTVYWSFGSLLYQAIMDEELGEYKIIKTVSLQDSIKNIAAGRHWIVVHTKNNINKHIHFLKAGTLERIQTLESLNPEFNHFAMINKKTESTIDTLVYAYSQDNVFKWNTITLSKNQSSFSFNDEKTINKTYYSGGDLKTICLAQDSLYFFGFSNQIVEYKSKSQSYLKIYKKTNDIIGFFTNGTFAYIGKSDSLIRISLIDDWKSAFPLNNSFQHFYAISHDKENYFFMFDFKKIIIYRYVNGEYEKINTIDGTNITDAFSITKDNIFFLNKNDNSISKIPMIIDRNATPKVEIRPTEKINFIPPYLINSAAVQQGPQFIHYISDGIGIRLKNYNFGENKYVDETYATLFSHSGDEKIKQIITTPQDGLYLLTNKKLYYKSEFSKAPSIDIENDCQHTFIEEPVQMKQSERFLVVQTRNKLYIADKSKVGHLLELTNCPGIRDFDYSNVNKNLIYYIVGHANLSLLKSIEFDAENNFNNISQNEKDISEYGTPKKIEIDGDLALIRSNSGMNAFDILNPEKMQAITNCLNFAYPFPDLFILQNKYYYEYDAVSAAFKLKDLFCRNVVSKASIESPLIDNISLFDMLQVESRYIFVNDSKNVTILSQSNIIKPSKYKFSDYTKFPNPPFAITPNLCNREIKVKIDRFDTRYPLELNKTLSLGLFRTDNPNECLDKKAFTNGYCEIPNQIFFNTQFDTSGHYNYFIKFNDSIPNHEIPSDTSQIEIVNVKINPDQNIYPYDDEYHIAYSGNNLRATAIISNQELDKTTQQENYKYEWFLNNSKNPVCTEDSYSILNCVANNIYNIILNVSCSDSLLGADTLKIAVGTINLDINSVKLYDQIEPPIEKKKILIESLPKPYNEKVPVELNYKITSTFPPPIQTPFIVIVGNNNYSNFLSDYNNIYKEINIPESRSGTFNAAFNLQSPESSSYIWFATDARPSSKNLFESCIDNCDPSNDLTNLNESAIDSTETGQEFINWRYNDLPIQLFGVRCVKIIKEHKVTLNTNTKINGPAIAEVNKEYKIYLSHPTEETIAQCSFSGHKIKYQIDWGDSSSADIFSPSDSEFFHEYTQVGEYVITIKAMCAESPSHISNDSLTYSVKIAPSLLQVPNTKDEEKPSKIIISENPFSAKLYLRKTGDKFPSLPELNDNIADSSITFNISEELLYDNIRGLEFYIELINADSVWATLPIIADTRIIQTRFLPINMQTPEWSDFITDSIFHHALSVPANLDNKILPIDNFNNQFSECDSFHVRWTHWDTETCSTLFCNYEYSDKFYFEPGRAHWLTTILKDKTINCGSGASTRPDSATFIHLNAGWNQIANPFAFDLNWKAIMDSTDETVSPLYSYSPNVTDIEKDTLGFTVDTILYIMKSWTGYFVQASADFNLYFDLQANPDWISHGDATVGKQQPDGWWIDITTSKIKSNICRIGQLENANSEYDNWDKLEGPFQYYPARLAIQNHSWERFPENYVMDFKPESEGDEWELTLSNLEPGEKIHLNFNPHEMPKKYRIIYEDTKNNCTVEIDPEKGYDLFAPKKEMSFKLIVGEKSYIENHGIQLVEKPDESWLGKNYPNPFNPTTTIEYALSTSCHVKINVFNLLGQHVTTLVDGYKSIGIHKAIFDAESLSSGLYFYSIETPELQDIKKMTILK